MTWSNQSLHSQPLEHDHLEKDDTFAAIADHLADIFQQSVGDRPPLSDDAVSRAGIYSTRDYVENEKNH